MFNFLKQIFSGSRVSHTSRVTSSGRGKEGRLIGACFGDASKAESLIAYEQKRSFGISSRAEAIEAAIERLEKDRR